MEKAMKENHWEGGNEKLRDFIPDLNPLPVTEDHTMGSAFHFH